MLLPQKAASEATRSIAYIIMTHLKAGAGLVADRAVLCPAGQHVRTIHQEENGKAHLDVVIDVGQLQREAAAEIPLCTAAGVARGQLRSVRLHVTNPVSAFSTDAALAGRGHPPSSQKQHRHRL
jgi:hypothetical protein